VLNQRNIFSVSTSQRFRAEQLFTYKIKGENR